MEEKFSLTRITKENGAAFYPYVLEHRIEWILEKDVMGVGMLNDEGKACGAAIVRPLQKNSAFGLEIVSFFVDETVRRQGAGRYMMHSVKLLCAKFKQERLCAVYPYPKLRDFDGLLKSEGFIVIAENQKIYRMNVADAAKSAFSGHTDINVRLVSELTAQQKAHWLSRFGKDFPDSLSPDKLTGEFMEEVSTVYLTPDEHVEAFALSGRVSDGSIYLEVMYASKINSLKMAQTFMGAVDAMNQLYPEDTLCVSVSADKMKNINEFAGQCEDSLVVQTMRTSVWYTKNYRDVPDDKNKPVKDSAFVDEGTEPLVIGFDAIVPRLNALSWLMDDLEMDNSVIIRGNEMPYITAQAEGAVPLKFTYIPDVGFGGENYFLNLSAELDMPDVDSVSDVCLNFNGQSRIAQAGMYGPEHKILVKAVLAEADSPTSGRMLRFFVNAFEADLKDWIYNVSATR